MAKNRVVQFLKHETVLVAALILALVSSFFVPFSFKRIMTAIDWKLLSVLGSLMLVVSGFRKQHVFSRLADMLLSKVQSALPIGFVLVGLAFFSSMLITNDVALITFVPFTITVFLACKMSYAILPVVVLQTIGANLGSSITPFGNPQNLYVYSKYDFTATKFFSTMIPFAITGAVVLSILLLVILGRKRKKDVVDPALVAQEHQEEKTQEQQYGKLSVVAIVRYCILFAIALGAVFSWIPWYIALLVVVLGMIPDHELYKEVDWSLLATFVGLFIFVSNISTLQWVTTFLQKILAGRVYLTTLLASQVMSNLPATLLLSRYTTDGVQLLLGATAGSCGTLIASMASVISYRYYSTFHAQHEDSAAGIGKYLGVFTLISVVVICTLSLCRFIIWH